MTFGFSNKSKENLQEVHPNLVKLCYKILAYEIIDFAIICGHRNKALQDLYFFDGRSKVRWPRSKHNEYPAEAIDFVVFAKGKVDWKDHGAYYQLIGAFKSGAYEMNIKIRSGGDWDGDGETKDQDYNDLGHIELIGE